MKKIIYLSGKMTGMPDFNYPAFNEAADNLRARGHTVMNPAENPVPACGSWEGYMRNAIAQVVQADTIVLLPGWASSRGAVVEYELARTLKIAVSHYQPDHPAGMHAMEDDERLVVQRWVGMVEAA